MRDDSSAFSSWRHLTACQSQLLKYFASGALQAPTFIVRKLFYRSGNDRGALQGALSGTSGITRIVAVVDDERQQHCTDSALELIRRLIFLQAENKVPIAS